LIYVSCKDLKDKYTIKGKEQVNAFYYKKLNIIECAHRGYSFFWQEKAFIARLGLPVLLLKFISYMAIYMLNLGESYFHHGLLLLPISFVEGWFLAILIRLAMFKERPTTLLECAHAPQKNALFATAIMFTLIKLVSAFLAALALENGLAEFQVNTENSDEIEPNLSIVLLAIAMFVAGLWAFRLIWLYVPIAMDIASTQFLKSIKPFGSSFYFMGIWMICSFPIMMVLGFSIQFVGLIGSVEANSFSVVQHIIIHAMQSITELIVSIVSTLAIAYALYAIIFDSKDT